MSKNGFTIVETLVAIFIVMFGVVSALILVTQSLGMVPLIQDRLTASYLAQQGIEELRLKRDTNYIKATKDTPSKTCVNIPNDCPCESNYWLCGINLSYTDTTDRFIRTVTISPIGSDSDQIKVTANVSWHGRGGDHSLEVVDYLFNWGTLYQ